MRLRSEAWHQYVSNDRRFAVSAIEPPLPAEVRPNAVRATVLVRIS